ncbi:TPA: hypothetical protein ENG04_07610 [Candidatus Poribacteria bacterium]|nr:hypothetical protein [Candidatus Poribacteria bacterium]HEX29933.1 hypothetical protein [Candidatus Poribacteria bacterium]
MERIGDKADLFVLLGCMDTEEAKRIQKEFPRLNLILISSGGDFHLLPSTPLSSRPQILRSPVNG